MNLRYLEEKPNVQGLGHEWYFDLDCLTYTLGYKHDKANQSAGLQEATTNPAGTQDADSDSNCDEQVIIVPSYPSHSIQGTEPKDTFGDKVDDSPLNSADEIFQKELARQKVPPGSIPILTGSIPVPSGDTMVSTDDVPIHTSSPTDSSFDDEPTTIFPSLSDLGNHDPSPGIFSSSSYDDEFGAALNNVAYTVKVSPVETKRITTIHPQSLIIRDHTSAVQTRSKVKKTTTGKYAIRTKWILKNKKDATGIVVLNKARLVAQRHKQEEGIDYDEVFAPVARIDAIRLFLAFASYIGFMVYQMDVKSAFVYGRIDEEVYKFSKDLMECLSAKTMKKIFKYLKGQLKLGLWYHRESALVLEAYSDSDYARANKDRKSTSGGCQFLGRRLISWECKKQTIVATSSTEAEYVVAANCCGRVLWIQNQLLNYGLMIQDGGLVIFKYSTWTRSPELGPPAIQATIDETPYTITEDLVRSQIQLADDGAAMLSQDQEGEGAGVAAQAVPQHISDPNIASFSRTHDTDDGPFTIVEDEPLGGSFHMSPPRSTQAPPAGQSSGGAEDLITLTDLSFVVSTLVQKVNSLETELKDHKKLLKDVVGKLVKKVKAMEVKLRTTKRKMVMTVTVDFNIPPGGASNNPAASTSVPADVPTSANVPTGSTSVPADVPTSVAPAGVSDKGKTPMVEEDITVKERTFKQMKDDRIREQAAKRLHDEEQAQVDRQRVELQRRRQQEVLASAMYYTDADWINIMAQVEANASLSKTLMGDDVSEDNFPARMAALIKRKKQALAEKLAKERMDRLMTQG
nr:ribonuclease H-like domain, reverse transcriptase, RNA-dependent DNA polymerase [Tanacetum cinerariifolium]